MNPLARILLRAKHWQLFVLVIGPWILDAVTEFAPDWSLIPSHYGFGTFYVRTALLELPYMIFMLAWL